MPTDPAPEKVAALAAVLRREWDAEAQQFTWTEDPIRTHVPDRLAEAEAILAALNAAGYDVARIEEGERLRAALADIAPAYHDLAAHFRPGLRPVSFVDCDFEVCREARAALAASDEAGHSQECIAAYYTDGGQSGCICGADALAASDEAVRP